jgi:prophage DNA circulation protein
MAWENTLLDASFRGVSFEVVTTGDDIERAILVNEYPYVDGASVEDMGRAPRRFSLTAIFYGEDYENRLEAFLQAIDVPGPDELIHPFFGAIRAQFMRSYISHDAHQPDSAYVTLDFLEAALNAPLFGHSLPIQQVRAIDRAAEDALAAARAGYAIDIETALEQPGTLPGLVRDKLGADMLDVIDTMHGLADQLVEARTWVASGLHYLENPLSFVNDVTGGLVARVSGLYSSFSLLTGYSGGGPGFTRGGLASVWHAPLVHLQQPLLPATPPPSGALTTDPAAVQPFLSTHINVQQAVAIARAAEKLYSADIDETVLTPADIEVVAADTRTAILGAIDAVRLTYPDIVRSRPITEPLKGLALAVTEAAEKLIRAKPPLRDRTVTTPGNLQLIAHLWYGDYRRAAELHRLNPNIRNPNFIPAGISLRSYAA